MYVQFLHESRFEMSSRNLRMTNLLKKDAIVENSIYMYIMRQDIICSYKLHEEYSFLMEKILHQK